MTRCNECNRPLMGTPQGACFFCLTPEKARDWARDLARQWREKIGGEAAAVPFDLEAELLALFRQSRWFQVQETMTELASRYWGGEVAPW